MAVYRRGATSPRVRFRGPVRRTSDRGGRSQIENLARTLADQIIRERDAAASRQRLGRIFTQFDGHSDVLPNNIETVTRGLFTGNTGSLVTMFTSSNLTATQKTYYQEIYSTGDPRDTSAASPELSIAYGHFAGSGSVDLTGNLNNDTPSRAIYKQYAQLLLPPNDKKFTINGIDTDSIYVLNFNRARIREKMDPGNFELVLAKMKGSAVDGFPPSGGYDVDGSGKTIKLMDDSSTAPATVGEAGLIYNIVSGTIDGGTAIFQANDPQYYGLLYPQHGIAILNGDALDANGQVGSEDDVTRGFGPAFGTNTASLEQGNNAVILFNSLSSSNDLVASDKTGGIQARSSEQVKSTYYFVRVKNAEYNYSNNPSFVTGSLGVLAFASFIKDPQTYITSVGMYNARRELLAIAKLSQPLLKNFTREALIKVKLDF